MGVASKLMQPPEGGILHSEPQPQLSAIQMKSKRSDPTSELVGTPFLLLLNKAKSMNMNLGSPALWVFLPKHDHDEFSKFD